MTDKNNFIESLVGELTPARHWLPSRRTALWVPAAIMANAIAMTWVQNFRPGFIEQLLNFPRFAVEIFSSFIFCVVLAYWAYSSLVPGNKIGKVATAIGVLSGFTWVVALSLSFLTESPPASSLGARPHCVEEVFIFGLSGASSFLFVLNKNDYSVSWGKYIAMGLCAGLIPATLMQMACMYSPMHSLLLHYGPLLLIGPMVFLLPKVRRLLKN